MDGWGVGMEGNAPPSRPAPCDGRPSFFPGRGPSKARKRKHMHAHIRMHGNKRTPADARRRTRTHTDTHARAHARVHADSEPTHPIILYICPSSSVPASAYATHRPAVQRTPKEPKRRPGQPHVRLMVSKETPRNDPRQPKKGPLWPPLGPGLPGKLAQARHCVQKTVPQYPSHSGDAFLEECEATRPQRTKHSP